ncbi:MAG: hypothetical protein K9N29_06850 [Candidatus Marinimicrobia bacterium]|nr:hypothetical protein [Candidatus Neomarinimicrobiota bacterium]
MKKNWGSGLANNPKVSLLLKRLMVLALVSTMAYVINRLLVIPMWPDFDFPRKYLGDILALPVYLPLSFYLALRLRLIPEDFKLHFMHIMAAGVIFSILFEGLVPLIDQTSTPDPFDILAYFAGGLVVYTVAALTRKQTMTTIQD